MRPLLLALALAAPSLACFCLNTATPCSALGDSTLVFLATVLVDSGEGWGTGPARVRIDEPLFHTPAGLGEVEIDTSAGTSCYYRLKAGQRYVIYAGNSAGSPGRLSIGACSSTFLLLGNENILDALRNLAQGGPARLVGKVFRSDGQDPQIPAGPGATVVAKSATAQFEAVSDSFGRYQIPGIAPGRYEVEVFKPGFVPDLEYNHAWSGRMVLNKADNVIEPDSSQPNWTVDISEKSCAVRNLSLWPDGRIAGTVLDVKGAAVSHVAVQAFPFDDNGKLDHNPLRIGTTDETGRYLIEPLPPGNYVVGVNAEPYDDTTPYPPALFSKSQNASQPAKVHVDESALADGIDIVLQAKRVAATLHVQVLDLNAVPHQGATVTLENLAGVQRFFSRDTTNAAGVIDVPVYLGERYVVKAFHFTSDPDTGRSVHLEGSASIDVSETSRALTIVLGPRRLEEEH